LNIVIFPYSFSKLIKTARETAKKIFVFPHFRIEIAGKM